jgi:hypothetical protein
MIIRSKFGAVKNGLVVGTFLIISLIVLAICKGPLKLASERKEKRHILSFNLNREGHIQTKIRVKKNEFDVIFDTGTYNSVIQNLVPGDLGQKQFKLTGHDGTTGDYPSRIVDTVQLGTLKIVRHEFVLHDSRNTSSSGIIGMDILKNYTMIVNFASHTIELTQNTTNPSLDSLNYGKINTDSGLAFMSLPIGKVNYNLLLDTGYDGFVDINIATSKANISGEKAEWVGRDNLLSYFDNYQKTTVSRFYKDTADVKVGKTVLEDEIVSYHDRNKRLNLAGMDFFKRFEKVMFDFPNKRIVFGNTLYKSLRYYCDLIIYFNGIGLAFSNDSLPIVTNIAHYNSGKNLSIGDTIVGFDHQSLISGDHMQSQVKPLAHLYEVDQGTNLSKFAKLVRHARFSKDHLTISILKMGRVENIQIKRQHLLTNKNIYIDYSAPLNILNTPYVSAKIQKNKQSEYILYKPIEP